MFCPTASFNLYTPAFYRKYLHDMLLEQRALYHGSVPHVVPMMIDDPKRTQHGSCAWADAAAIIPWQQYVFFGDKSLLAEEYENMRAWADYLRREDQENGDRRLRTSGFHFADWLALDNPDKSSCFGGTDPYYVASAYYYRSILCTAKAARALGREDEASFYGAWAEEIREAFQKTYLLPGGDNPCRTQTSYVLALAFDLVPEADRAHAFRLLEKKLEEDNLHLTTGFTGTPELCPVLSQNGNSAYAYHLLFNDDYPSWLYEVGMGATTVWERWNSVLPDGRISDTGMNSLNHYAYGSIAEWMYRTMCGINPSEETPGFRRIVLRPVPDARLSFAKAAFRSPVGMIESGWELEGRRQDDPLQLHRALRRGSRSLAAGRERAHAAHAGPPRPAPRAAVTPPGGAAGSSREPFPGGRPRCFFLRKQRPPAESNGIFPRGCLRSAALHV